MVRSARCLDVDDSFLRLIISPESTDPIPLSDGQAVKVHGFEDGYFVSAYFHDDDGVWPDRTGVGIWWADRLDVEAMIWAVNERAGISDWADASTAREPDDPKLSIYSDGAEESFDCVVAKRAEDQKLSRRNGVGEHWDAGEHHRGEASGSGHPLCAQNAQKASGCHAAPHARSRLANTFPPHPAKRRHPSTNPVEVQVLSSA